MAISSAWKQTNIEREREVEEEMSVEVKGGKEPGLPAAELGGPSRMVKGPLRTEGRGRSWSTRLVWTWL